MKKLRPILLFVLLSFISLYGKDRPLKQIEYPLKVFYDGGGTLFNYLRTDINFVHFVRNQTEAQVHLQINSSRTGDGGREYFLLFRGMGKFNALDDTLITSVPGNVADKERDEQLVKIVKLGLVRYLSKTPYNKHIDVVFEKEFDNESFEDNWDGWIFGLGLRFALEGEESKKEFFWAADVDVDRVKEESKIKINGFYSRDIKEFDNDEELSTQRKVNYYLDLLYVASVSDHFSAGFFSDVRSRTFDNIKFGFNLSPAIEYNFFPYRESVRKIFTLLYRVGYTRNNYFEKTIFFKDNESLFRQSFAVDYRLNEVWGEANFNLRASSYLHDLEQNRVEFRTRLSYRLSGNFLFDVLAEASYVNDQIYLPQEGATLEEILLNQKKLSTQYEYELRFGFRYTFGSIYNNVVNARF